MSGTGHSDTAHLNTGARALDSLPPVEAAEFDRHIAECDACAVEYSEFVEVASLLAAAVAEPPPAGLRERVLTAAMRTPQLPPLAGAADHTYGQSWQTGAEKAGAARPSAVAGRHRSDDLSPGRPGSSGPRTQWWRRPVGWIAAAAAIAVLVTGGVLLATQQRHVSPDEAAQRCVAAASDAHVVEPSVGDGGSVTIASSCHAAVVQLASMPKLPTGKGYQLWVMAGEQARSEGMVTSVVADAGDVVVTGLHPSDTDIGISVEPAGGSKTPTTTPVWVVPINS